MKTIDEARYIIRNSKRYEFVDGDNGCTVLVITDYYSGQELRLDLSYIDEDILDALQVEADEEQEDEYEECYNEMAYHEFTASGGCRD